MWKYVLSSLCLLTSSTRGTWGAWGASFFPCFGGGESMSGPLWFFSHKVSESTLWTVVFFLDKLGLAVLRKIACAVFVYVHIVRKTEREREREKKKNWVLLVYTCWYPIAGHPYRLVVSTHPKPHISHSLWNQSAQGWRNKIKPPANVDVYSRKP